MKTKQKLSGFTLVEILVAASIFTVAMGALTSFFIQMLTGFNVTSQRIAQGSNIRKFTNEMITQSSRANQFILFKSSATADWNDITGLDRLVIDTNPVPIQHPAGDFAVFVFYKIPKLDTDTYYKILSIEGYYLDVSGGGTGRLRKVVFNYNNRLGSKQGVPWDPADPTDGSVEKIMSDNWATAVPRFSDFVLNIRGLAMPDLVDSTTTPRLFYMQDPRNIVISGQIYQANGGILTGNIKTYTDSFNFVVTPRS